MAGQTVRQQGGLASERATCESCCMACAFTTEAPFCAALRGVVWMLSPKEVANCLRLMSRAPGRAHESEPLPSKRSDRCASSPNNACLAHGCLETVPPLSSSPLLILLLLLLLLPSSPRPPAFFMDRLLELARAHLQQLTRRVQRVRAVTGRL